VEKSSIVCSFFYFYDMKLYVVSGLGADFKVLERLTFPADLEVSFLNWLQPEKGEDFHHYIRRMADRIDDREPFALLGYSFGGIIVQEIHRLKPAEKVIIMGSIRSHREKSRLLRWGERTRLPAYLPSGFYGERSTFLYTFTRRFFDPSNPALLQYFRVRDPYYLKWSIAKISAWKFEPVSGVVQIMADRDLIFPIANSKPDYIIRNASHLFPATRAKEVSRILDEIFGTMKRSDHNSS